MLDLSGGWFDAGDTNKYVTFASEAVHGLLAAYRRYPDVFDDDVGIPESGNGIPDIIDEVKWEIDWLERMQMDDGGVLTKVGLIEGGAGQRPAQPVNPLPVLRGGVLVVDHRCVGDVRPCRCRLRPGSRSSRTTRTRLRQRAIDAWNWYQENIKRDNCDPQVVRAGDADLSIEAQRRPGGSRPGAYLFALTGSGTYNAAIRQHYERHAALHPATGSATTPHTSRRALLYTGVSTAPARPWSTPSTTGSGR